MRTLVSKIATGVMVAGLGLSIAACSKHDDTNTTADTNMTDMNTMDSSAGMSNDASAMDASGNMGGDNMAVDNAAGGNATNASNAM